jgi:hypothetical protein
VNVEDMNSVFVSDVDFDGSVLGHLFSQSL